ncbi:hypothetical protein ABEB36_007752 [Hypothenemus hampei]|uniref:Uncharacterized protein n=1 Tax=Hypothenemus hampei TaxID=57062 RepID=A0ABD1EV12_HYPHA
MPCTNSYCMIVPGQLLRKKKSVAQRVTTAYLSAADMLELLQQIQYQFFTNSLTAEDAVDNEPLFGVGENADY